MLERGTEGRHLIVFGLVAFLPLLLVRLVVKTHFAETTIRIDLVAILHLLVLESLANAGFVLQRVRFLSHDFVGVGSPAHFWLIVVCIHAHKVLPLLELVWFRCILRRFKLQLFELGLLVHDGRNRRLLKSWCWSLRAWQD